MEVGQARVRQCYYLVRVAAKIDVDRAVEVCRNIGMRDYHFREPARDLVTARRVSDMVLEFGAEVYRKSSLVLGYSI